MWTWISLFFGPTVPIAWRYDKVTLGMLSPMHCSFPPAGNMRTIKKIYCGSRTIVLPSLRHISLTLMPLPFHTNFSIHRYGFFISRLGVWLGKKMSNFFEHWVFSLFAPCWRSKIRIDYTLHRETRLLRKGEILYLLITVAKILPRPQKRKCANLKHTTEICGVWKTLYLIFCVKYICFWPSLF